MSKTGRKARFLKGLKWAEDLLKTSNQLGHKDEADQYYAYAEDYRRALRRLENE